VKAGRFLPFPSDACAQTPRQSVEGLYISSAGAPIVAGNGINEVVTGTITARAQQMELISYTQSKWTFLLARSAIVCNLFARAEGPTAVQSSEIT
jgi:hypothetical protein